MEDLAISFSVDGDTTVLRSIQRFDKEIATAKKSVDSMSSSLVGATKGMDVAGASASESAKKISLLGAAVAAIGTAAVVAFGRESLSAFSDYDQALQDLSAITGATGKDLQSLGVAARDMERDVTGGATAALKAMEAIGSAKPELLDSSEALVSMTKAANTLAKASGDELPQSAANLTGIMNQFGATAEEADRYINVLAAGSLEGAANITELAASFKDAGAIANAFNVPVEASVAALEALADKSIKGAQAGTALRNILAKMAAADTLPNEALDALDEFGVSIDVIQDKTLSFDERLKEMSKIAGSTSAIVKVFGVDNQAAAQILLSSTKRVSELTKAVTGTNTAYSQAATRTKSFAAQMERVGNSVKGVMIDLGEAIAPVVGALADFLEVMIENKPVVLIFAGVIATLSSAYLSTAASAVAARVAILANTIAVAASNAAVNVATFAQAAYITATNAATGSITLATAATRLFNLVLASNPIGLVIGAVTALGAAIYLLSNSTKELTEEQKRQADLSEKLSVAYGKETASSAALFSTLKSELTSREGKLEAIKQINTQYGEYLPSLLTEKSSLKDIEAAQNAVNEALLKKIRLQVKEQEIMAVVEKQQAGSLIALKTITAQTNLSQAQISSASSALSKTVAQASNEQVVSILSVSERWDLLLKQLSKASGVGEEVKAAIDKITASGQDAVDAFVDLTWGTSAFNKQIDEITKFFNEGVDPLEIEQEGGDKVTETVSLLRDQIKALKESQDLTSTAEGWGAIQKEIDATQKKIDAITGGGAKLSKEFVGAAGSISYLEAQLSKLNESFGRASTDTERIGIGKKIRGITDEIEIMKKQGEALSEEGVIPKSATEGVADFGLAALNSVRAYGDFMTKIENETPEALTTLDKLKAAFGPEGFAAVQSALAATKQAFRDFAVNAVQSIGEAIGSSTSALDAFKNAIRSLLVEVPRMAGFALLNAAAFPANAAIALPLTIAGLALLGLSGVIKGIQSRNQKRREATADVGGDTIAGRAMSGGLSGIAQSASGRTEPIVIQSTVNLDGREVGRGLKKVELKRG